MQVSFNSPVLDYNFIVMSGILNLNDGMSDTVTEDSVVN